MAIPFLNHIDLLRNQIQNAVVQPLAVAPSSPVLGQFYFDTVVNKLKTYNGAAWDQMSTSNGTVTSITLTQPTAGLTITNTGVAQTSTGSFTFAFSGELAGLVGLTTSGLVTRTASGAYTGRTITGTANQIVVTNGDGVSGSPTLSLPQSIHTAANVTFNSVTISEAQTTATASSHAATVGLVTSLINGMSWKPNVTYVAATNQTLTGASTPDGTAVVTGDRVLCIAQTTVGQNGIWVANTVGAWTRPVDFNSWSQVPGAVVSVIAGTTYADTQWIATASASGTFGITDPVFSELPTPMATLAGAGLVKNGNTIGIQSDGSTLEVSSDVLRVKAGGIGGAQLATSAVDLASVKVTGILPEALGGTGQGSVSGLTIPHRPSVDVATNININIAAPGASIDGGALASSQRVLLLNQTTPSQNGPWLWNGASVPMSRPMDYKAGSTTHAYRGVEYYVLGGSTYQGVTWVISTNGAITIDTTATTWIFKTYQVSTGVGVLGTSQGGTGAATATEARANLGAAGKYATSFGDGTTTSWTITHNLGTTDVNASFHYVATGQACYIDYVKATTNTITFSISPAVSTNQLRVVVIG